MAVPRNRHSKARKNSRRAHHAKKMSNVLSCPRCSAPRLSHVVCSGCGTYGERKVVEVQQ